MSTTTLTIFDPSMCCSTGVCGPDVDPALAQFSSDLEWLADQGVQVARYNLAQEPGAFAEDSDAKAFLEREGESALPLLKGDGEVVDHGEYPGRETLAEWVNLGGDDAAILTEESATEHSEASDAESDGCCSGTADEEPSTSGCCS